MALPLRTAVFIDGGYVDKILYENGGLRVDFYRLAHQLATDAPLLRAYYYHCQPRILPNAGPEEIAAVRNKEKFFHALQHIDLLDVRLGHLAYRGTDDQGQPLLEQKGVDVQMAVDILNLCFHRLITHIILICGDGDLQPVVVKAKEMGAMVTLMHGDGPSTGVSERLYFSCDRRMLMDRRFLLSCQLGGRDKPNDNHLS